MKCKNILVKKLRKVGYSNAEAMRIAKEALIEYKLDSYPIRVESFYNSVMRDGVISLFVWELSERGHHYWSDINNKLQRFI